MGERETMGIMPITRQHRWHAPDGWEACLMNRSLLQPEQYTTLYFVRQMETPRMLELTTTSKCAGHAGNPEPVESTAPLHARRVVGTRTPAHLKTTLETTPHPFPLRMSLHPIVRHLTGSRPEGGTIL